jgi:phospholipid/cholesterol/gamma-HCH transport system permease protein
MTSGPSARPYAIAAEGNRGGPLRLRLTGDLGLSAVEPFGAETAALLADRSPSSLSIDLSGLASVDSAGALSLMKVSALARDRAIPVTMTGAAGETGRLLALVGERTERGQEAPEPPEGERSLEELGRKAVALSNDIVGEVSFLGEMFLATGRAHLRPKTVRWPEVWHCMRRAGVDGFPIVALISFLMGLIIAFMSSLQLKQFGAYIYVADLVAIAIVRELGPIMTAIIVAGRSGSAFAAEIGTMKVNEEVDALVTMGFDPMRFLVVPKVLAMVVVVPLLTVYSDLFGVLGGLVVGVVGLDLTAHTYLAETHKVLSSFTVAASLLKTVVFALLISSVGCQRGFRARGGADAVGTAATSAVVTSIFLIIVTDSMFAVALQYLRR